MMLKTFLKRLEVQPIDIRHDAYENKDILIFEKKDGFFPYIEFQSKPADKVQNIYVDVLNWNSIDTKQQYMNNDEILKSNTKDFIYICQLKADNVFSVIDAINLRLRSFYMLYSEHSKSK